MAEIKLENLGHAYGAGGAYALKPLNMTWADGQTYALLGPSGCGKSTMLNIISGLIRPSEGRVLFDGQDMTHADTGQRNIAQVFQVPVIYRSMTVADNLAFPLVCRKVPATQIAKRVEQIADRLGLASMLRKPANSLTADQKQLVSLGRGLVRDDVSAILLDEPLTVIDPQMKFELRKILKQINEEYRLTMVLVTHDQNEAMTFAKTVIVMNHGEVIQAGSPIELFERPATEYVGYFIGSPPMNYLPAVIEDGHARVQGTSLSVKVPPGTDAQGLKVGFRPEHLQRQQDGVTLSGSVERVWYEGTDEVLALTNGQHSFRARVRAAAIVPGQTVSLNILQDSLRLYCDGRMIA